MGNPLNIPNQQPNMQQMQQQFNQNPMRYLTGLNIPQGMTDPEQIVRHLDKTGQIPPMLQAKVNAMLGRR
jgi:hypothetical protein